MSTIVTSRSTSPTAIKIGTDSPGLGTLVMLPREIRDEIYRYLVKGRVRICYDAKKLGNAAMNKAIWESSIGKLSFAIFQVSKTTYDEATTIFCSESVFRYYICPLEDDSIFPPALMSNRMMKIELDFGFILRFYQKDSLYRRELERNFEATLDKFGGLSARKALLIRFKSNSPEALGLMSDNFVPRLKALIGFRTVTVDVGPNPHSAIEKHYRERYQQIAQVIRDELAPKMGPAITSHSGLSTYLEFHPLEHIRANLSARAEAIWSKINMVGSGAD